MKVKWEGEFLERLKDVSNPSRIIFAHQDFFIKVDHRPEAAWQTRQTARELEFYDTLEEDKEHFAQILESGKTKRGKWWIRQKRYYPDRTANRNNIITLLALEFKYNLADITYDTKPPFFEQHSNWMVSEGEVIVYDWGGYKA